MFGYTVNLDWVTRSYFSEIVVAGVRALAARGENLDFAVLDERGQPITGQRHGAAGDVALLSAAVFRFRHHYRRSPARSRFAAGRPGEHRPRSHARLGDAERRLDPAGRRSAAAFTLGLSLIFTVHIVRVNARLAEMRSDFVSTVTHELRTPLATIRAVGDTLVRAA